MIVGEGKRIAKDDFRILLADNQGLFRAGMRHLLGKLPQRPVVIEAATGAEAVDMLREFRFDLAMIDLAMPDIMHAPLLMAICTEAKGVPVMVVSGSEEPEHVCLAIENGAAGFVPKSSSPEVMVQAVMLVLSGGVYLPPSVLDIVRSGGKATKRDQHGLRTSDITVRQYIILQYLASGSSNKQIARALGISEGTVKSHISSLLRALKAKNRTHAIVIASHQGILRAIPESGRLEEFLGNGDVS